MRTLRLVFPFALTLSAFAACGGGELVTSDAPPATGGTAVGTGGAAIGTGGTPSGTGGAGLGASSPGGDGGGNGEGGAPPEPPACDRHVHILLQKSGAMFQSPAAEDNWWDAVAAALTDGGGLVDEFGSQVELSVSVFSKNNAETTDTCPLIAEASAPIDPDDLEDVLADEKSEFEDLVAATVKVDAPVVDAVEQATEMLAGEDAYLVLIASDIPDSCATDDTVCTSVEVFSSVQAAHAAGIETRVVYLTSTGSNVAGYPQGVANAGVGEGIADPSLGCTFDYSDTPGSAPFAQPENTGAVEQALADILADIAACD